MPKYNAIAVIGGGYGDEGKGLNTDFWASNLNNPTVIRFNGGSQAGHTVQTPDGKHHVFSHFSAGTFVNAPTFLSRFFVVNPLLFQNEHQEFVKKFGFSPTVYVDPDCYTTTPIEMLINQELETHRNHDKHGSCGVGFGETLERVKQLRKPLTIGYMCNASQDEIGIIINDIVTEYLPFRLDASMLDERLLSIINNPKLVDDYYISLQYFKEHTNIVADKSILREGDIVFEGAQGLEIDQDYGIFPYVTRSNCGMRNVTNLIDELGLDLTELVVDYITRAYKTRHGAGPLRREITNPFPFKDSTNSYNHWQGHLRWGAFNYSEYRSITDIDFALYANERNPYYKVYRMDTITCMDQVEEIVQNRLKGFFANSNTPVLIVNGPTRDNVVHDFS